VVGHGEQASPGAGRPGGAAAVVADRGQRGVVARGQTRPVGKPAGVAADPPTTNGAEHAVAEPGGAPPEKQEQAVAIPERISKSSTRAGPDFMAARCCGPSGVDKVAGGNWLTGVVNNPRFDLFFGSLILVNAVSTAFSLEFEGEAMADDLGVGRASAKVYWDSVSDYFLAASYAFSISFSVELALRGCAGGVCFLKNTWNVLDLIAVLAAWIDLGVVPDPSDNMPNLTAARVLRLIRLTKVLRVVRVTKIFGELRLLIKTYVASMLSLFWSMVLLLLAMIIASVFIGQLIQPVVLDDERDLEVRLEAWEMFGTFSRSFITMFEVTMSAGGWGRSGRFLTYQVDRRFFLFFFAYFLFVSFALMKVISAVFIKQTLQVASRDQEKIAAEQAQATKGLVDRCKQAFKLADTSHDGTVTVAELVAAASSPEVKAYLAANELDVTEVPRVFELLDVGNDGTLNFDEFVTGVERLRGGARQLDVASLEHETKRMLTELSQIHQGMSRP